MERPSTPTSSPLWPAGGMADASAVCVQHADSNCHIHTTKPSTRSSQMVTLNQSLNPMQHSKAQTAHGMAITPPGHTGTHHNHPYAATYMRKKLIVHVKAARLLGVCCVSAAVATKAIRASATGAMRVRQRQHQGAPCQHVPDSLTHTPWHFKWRKTRPVMS